jgi:hypothetical protein
MGNFWISELNEGIALGSGCPLGAGNFDAQNIAVLAKVRFKLLFQEAVGEMADIDNTFLE